jgi:processive 1,2-diacylglycerol beta-glucosyltransferase
MGGGDGLLPMEEIISSLIKDKPSNLHLVALTGKNKSLYKNLLTKFGNDVEVYSFTDKVPELFCGADMIVSKAGGLSSAEILASNLEYIIYKPLPGQEENNAKFLQANCGATIATNIKEVNSKIKELCGISASQTEKNKQFFGKPKASESICNYILCRLQKI